MNKDRVELMTYEQPKLINPNYRFAIAHGTSCDADGPAFPQNNTCDGSISGN